MRKQWKLAATVFLACCGLAGAGVVTVDEKYARDPAAAWFPPGRIGSCFGLWTYQPMVYPVLFRSVQAPEGTVSFWFKPTRKFPGDYYATAPVVISGIGSFGLSGGDAASSLSLHCPGASVPLGEDAWKTFHHVAYTWNQEREQVYFDGKRISDTPRKPGAGRAKETGAAMLSLYSPTGVYLDELLILDRCADEAGIAGLFRANKAWVVDSRTVFYAGFEGSIRAAGYVDARGDTLRMYSLIGRTDATFGAGDKPEIAFRILNASGRGRNLRLKGLVRDLDKRTVLKKALPVKAAAGAVTGVPFSLGKILANGLFWGYFTLEEDGRIIQTENIPFAKTLAVDARKCSPGEMRTGFTVPDGFNPALYQKWGLLHFDGWSLLEPAPGEWYFDRLDLKVNSLLASKTVPIVMFSYPPPWYQKKYKSTGLLGYYYPDTDNPEAMDLWKNHVRTVGRRYQGKVFHYEVCGEAYGRSDPRHYGRLVNITADVLHEIDPAIQVACNYSGYHDWAKTVAQTTAGKADCYTFHPYGWVCGEDPAQLTDENDLRPYIAMLKEAGAKVKLANTEYGCYQALGLAVHPDGYPMNKEEFDRAASTREMPYFFTKRGRFMFVDWFTGASRVVRGNVMNLAVDVEHALWWSSSGNVISALKFAPNTPSPESAAFANFSGLLAGHHFVRRVDLGANYLKGYLFRKDKKYLLCVFTDGRATTVYPEAAGEKMEVLDLYGNPVPFVRAGTMLELNLKPLIPLYVRNITGVPARSTPVLKAESETDVYPGTRSAVKVTVYNPLPGTLRGTVRLKLPAPFADMPARQVALASRETKELLFEVAVPDSVVSKQEMEAELSSDTGELQTISYTSILPVKLSVPARFVDTPPALDGAVEKWGDPVRFPIVIDNPEQVIKGIPYTKLYLMDQRVDWSGAKDLSARGTAAYDQQNLYLFFRVYDDKVMNLARKEPIYIYEGDSVEIFIDGRDEKSRGDSRFTGDVYHIKLAPSTDPKLPPFHHVSKPRGKDIPGFAYASQLLSDGYTMEVKIPWTAFPSLKPAPGLKLGFALHLNDQDEAGFGNLDGARSKVTMLWGGAKGVSGDPSRFGTIILK